MRDTCPVTDSPVPTGGGPDAPHPDALCAGTVDIAAAAVAEVGGDQVGEHLGCVPAGDPADGLLADHYFACTHPGYRGWRWCVTVARPAEGADATVDEVALLPGDEAVLAPPWLPWSERVQPGDVGPGDLLPTAPDDPRLVPAFADPQADDPAVAEVAYEFGLGRVRVLSLDGRAAAADRWYAGDGGPEAPLARQAPAPCGTCGFYLPLAGALGRAFGVCGNAIASDDGRAVSADHGCGAHSEAAEPPPPAQADPPPPLVDDHRYEYEVVPS